MRIRVDERFSLDAERFRLRFTCVDCLHYLAGEDACAHEWPNQDHREPPAAVGDAEVVFCKEFELR